MTPVLQCGRGLINVTCCLHRQVGLDLKDIPSDAQVVDATGKLVMPGEWVEQWESVCKHNLPVCYTITLALTTRINY
jgi:hypothetical protein